MIVIKANSVEEALYEACRKLLQVKVETESRNGKVWRFPCPVTTQYSRPWAHVLFDEDRDANPFFHLMEAVWMLAGRRDVELVSRYNSSIHMFSDDGHVFNGAYGHRWRHWFKGDQITRVLENLNKNPFCRRQVITMYDGHWDPHVDSKDIPCNTQIYFEQDARVRALNMTVSNRSNDLIWGAYGANAVHFSTLLMVMAGALGWSTGRYWQMSNNLHVYERHFDLVRKLAEKSPEPVPGRRFIEDRPEHALFDEQEAQHILAEADSFLMEGPVLGMRSRFLRTVVWPVAQAWEWLQGKPKQEVVRYDVANGLLERCKHPDWQRACMEWVERRRKRWLS